MPRRARLLPLALVSAAFAVIAACSSSGGGAASDSSAASTTTTAPTVATTATPLTLVAQADPLAAASALIDAWKAGDEATAATVAAPSAVRVLFDAGTPHSVESRGCSDPKYDPAQCVYRTDLGEVQVRTTMQGDGWVVDQARITPA